MNYFTVSLYDLLKRGVGKEDIMKILSDFSCPVNNDVENFLHVKAFDFERVGLARTNLIYALSEGNMPILVAFFTIGLSHVVVGEKLSKNDRKRVLGTSFPIGSTLKTLLIGQLAKNYTSGYNQLITGEMLMDIIFERISVIHQMMPSVVTHIDCKDVLPLRDYYEKFGFTLFKRSKDQLVYLLPTNKIIEKVNN